MTKLWWWTWRIVVFGGLALFLLYFIFIPPKVSFEEWKAGKRASLDVCEPRPQASGSTWWVSMRANEECEPTQHEVDDYLRALAGGNSPEIAALRANLHEAWTAFAMIREAVETLGPVGAVPAGEHLAGPTFTHEAEAIIAGIKAMARRGG